MWSRLEVESLVAFPYESMVGNYGNLDGRERLQFARIVVELEGKNLAWRLWGLYESCELGGVKEQELDKSLKSHDLKSIA